MAATAPGGSGNSGANGANSAGSDSATDGLGNAADSVADAIGQAAEAVADAVASALSSVNDAAGLSDALGQLGSMLGIDAKDLQGIVGAALMGVPRALNFALSAILKAAP